jgi:Ca2+-binding RTX toxin-like protein
MRPAASVAALSAAALSVTTLILAAPAGAAAVTCAGHQATIVGTAKSEVLHGTSGPDVIAGVAGSDTIDGRGGNDIICGGRGLDRLNGGSGNDRLYGGADALYPTEEGTTERIGDQLRGGPGDDWLDAGRDTRSADDITLDQLYWDDATGPVTIHLDTGNATGEGHDTFVPTSIATVGSTFNDRIFGSTASDFIVAGAGNDVVYGGPGNDRIYPDSPSPSPGSANADVSYGGKGNDEISTSGGFDKSYGGDGNDVLDDFEVGPDLLDGGAGNDLVAYDLADTASTQLLTGGSGFDTLSLFSNQVDPTATPATGIWHMGSGHMQFTVDIPIQLSATAFEKGDLSTFGASWIVFGTPNADAIEAGSIHAIVFYGAAGDDTLLGSAGDDTFNGGPGTDHSLGMGVGDDTCISVETIDGDDCEHVTP